MAFSSPKHKHKSIQCPLLRSIQWSNSRTQFYAISGSFHKSIYSAIRSSIQLSKSRSLSCSVTSSINLLYAIIPKFFYLYNYIVYC